MDIFFHATDATDDNTDSSELVHVGTVPNFAQMLNRSFSLGLTTPMLCQLGLNGEYDVARSSVQPGDALRVVDACPSGHTVGVACTRAARGRGLQSL